MKNNILCFIKFFVKNNSKKFEKINSKFIHFNITNIKNIFISQKKNFQKFRVFIIKYNY